MTRPDITATRRTAMGGSEFSVVTAKVYFHLHPKYIGNSAAGIHAGLSELIMW